MKNALEIQDVESLKLRFPHMFAGSVISMDFYKGWFPDFVRLCFELDALLGDERYRFHWEHLREKFGGYLMYFTFSFSEEEKEGTGSLTALSDLLESTVDRCAAVMENKCFVCGDHGTKTTGTRLISTLCEYHGDDARHARGDRRPLYEVAAVPKFPGDDACGGAP